MKLFFDPGSQLTGLKFLKLVAPGSILSDANSYDIDTITSLTISYYISSENVNPIFPYPGYPGDP
ncbi:MAG: hypothetical protein IJ382_02995 [Flavobacteriales bacterium]|nr:hypothetical protein [Flavobacteriales bacterium]